MKHTAVACAYFASEIEDPRPIDPHVEFITPLHGPDREDPVSRPQRDSLHAAPLRYVDLLIEDAIPIDDPVLGGVRIPHPLHYVLQKNLIRRMRQVESKQAKDQSDAFYVLANLRAAWPTWREQWIRLCQVHERKTWLAGVERQWLSLYRPPMIAWALEIHAAYPGVSPAQVCRVMDEFRQAVLPT